MVSLNTQLGIVKKPASQRLREAGQGLLASTIILIGIVALSLLLVGLGD